MRIKKSKTGLNLKSSKMQSMYFKQDPSREKLAYYDIVDPIHYYNTSFKNYVKAKQPQMMKRALSSSNSMRNFTAHQYQN